MHAVPQTCALPVDGQAQFRNGPTPLGVSRLPHSHPRCFAPAGNGALQLRTGQCGNCLGERNEISGFHCVFDDCQRLQPCSSRFPLQRYSWKSREVALWEVQTDLDECPRLLQQRKHASGTVVLRKDAHTDVHRQSGVGQGEVTLKGVSTECVADNPTPTVTTHCPMRSQALQMFTINRLELSPARRRCSSGRRTSSTVRTPGCASGPAAWVDGRTPTWSCDGRRPPSSIPKRTFGGFWDIRIPECSRPNSTTWSPATTSQRWLN